MYIPVLKLNSWVISRPPNWIINVKKFLLYLRPLIWGKRWASLEILESRKWLLAATFCKGSMQSEHNQNMLHWQWATVRLLQGGHWLTVGQAFKTHCDLVKADMMFNQGESFWDYITRMVRWQKDRWESEQARVQCLPETDQSSCCHWWQECWRVQASQWGQIQQQRDPSATNLYWSCSPKPQGKKHIHPIAINTNRSSKNRFLIFRLLHLF